MITYMIQKMDKSGNYKKVKVSGLKNYDEINEESSKLIAFDCKLELSSRVNTVKNFRIVLTDGTVYKFDIKKFDRYTNSVFELIKTGEEYEWNSNEYKLKGGNKND